VICPCPCLRCADVDAEARGIIGVKMARSMVYPILAWSGTDKSRDIKLVLPQDSW